MNQSFKEEAETGCPAKLALPTLWVPASSSMQMGLRVSGLKNPPSLANL